MRKLPLIVALLTAALSSPALAAGTIPGISMTQQLDEFAKPLSGGKLFLIQAGTTASPQNCYQDTGLTLPWPNPITLDAAGRVPQLFCADGNIKIRLTDKNGLQKLVQDNLLVVGPSGGGGGGGTVDPTTIFQTGAFMQFYGTNVLTGWVRCNGKTIGSASSGASERSNVDVQSLFQYLWNADGNLAVSGGRGVSAAADWAANKQLTLPDCRGRVVAGLDDMGNSAAGRLTSSYFGSTATTLGVSGGSENTALTLAQLPTGITSSGTLTVTGVSNSALTFMTSNSQSNSFSTGTGGSTGWQAQATGATVLTQGANATGTVTSNNTTGSAHRTVQPTILATTFIKL